VQSSPTGPMQSVAVSVSATAKTNGASPLGVESFDVGGSTRIARHPWRGCSFGRRPRRGLRRVALCEAELTGAQIPPLSTLRVASAPLSCGPHYASICVSAGVLLRPDILGRGRDPGRKHVGTARVCRPELQNLNTFDRRGRQGWRVRRARSRAERGNDECASYRVGDWNV